jgi:hypothetical protein
MAAKNDGNKGLDTAISGFIDKVINLEPKPSVELSGIDNELTRDLISRVLFRPDSNLGDIPRASRPQVSNHINQEYRVSPDGKAWNRVTLLKSLESADYITVHEKSRARNELHQLIKFAVDLEHLGAAKAVHGHGGFFNIDFEAKAMLYEKLGQEISLEPSSGNKLLKDILFEGVDVKQQDERLNIILTSLKFALDKGLLERGERLQKFLDALAQVVSELKNHSVAHTFVKYMPVIELREFCISAITKRAKGDPNSFLARLVVLLGSCLNNKNTFTPLMTMTRDYVCGKKGKFEGIEKLDGIDSTNLKELSKLIRSITRRKDLNSSPYIEELCRESLPVLYNKEVSVLLKPLREEAKSFEQLAEAHQNKLVEALRRPYTRQIFLEKANPKEITACAERLSDTMLHDLRELNNRRFVEHDCMLRLNETLDSLIMVFKSGHLTGDIGLGNIKAICEGITRKDAKADNRYAIAFCNEVLQKMKLAGF